MFDGFEFKRMILPTLIINHYSIFFDENPYVEQSHNPNKINKLFVSATDSVVKKIVLQYPDNLEALCVKDGKVLLLDKHVEKLRIRRLNADR